MYKWEMLRKILKSKSFLASLSLKKLPARFGVGLDERIVEFPWTFSNISNGKSVLLDAGSVFNHKQILDLEKIKNKDLTIFTYYPELENFNERRVSYVYGDLRSLPFKEGCFDEIVCQSTIEHIDMDNSMYGYDIENSSAKNEKSYEYLKSLEESVRVLKTNGTLLLTFPFGKFEKHVYFQQLDSEMVAKIKNYFAAKGEFSVDYFKYTESGWIFSSEDECRNAVPYNPHTGVGKGTDGAAHSRAVCCIKFIKK